MKSLEERIFLWNNQRLVEDDFLPWSFSQFMDWLDKFGGHPRIAVMPHIDDLIRATPKLERMLSPSSYIRNFKETE